MNIQTKLHEEIADKLERLSQMNPEDENYKALYEQLRDYGHPRPKTPVYPQVSTSFQQVLEDVALSGRNVEDEMDKSVERINAKLKRYTR